MRVVVDDVSTSYLYVGTPELDLLRKSGVAAVHSTPIISHSARLWGLISTYFRKPQPESQYDPAPLDRLAVQLADHMEKFDSEFTGRSAAKS
jgi:GAF domain-containing protein